MVSALLASISNAGAFLNTASRTFLAAEAGRSTAAPVDGAKTLVANCHRFSVFRAEDGSWALTQEDVDFTVVFPDLAAALEFARTFCQSDDASVTVRTCGHKERVSCPLSSLGRLSEAELLELLRATPVDGHE